MTNSFLCLAWISLGTLNEDVLYLILNETKGSYLSISAASRLFRALCKPIIFNHVIWGMQTTPRPPLDIWPYIQ